MCSVLPLLRSFAGTTGAKHQVVAYTEKSQDKHESRHIQLVREYGFHPRSKVQVEDGAVLPRKFEPFPDDMYGRPLEEIDNFIYEEVSGAGFARGNLLLPVFFLLLDREIIMEMETRKVETRVLSAK